RGFGHLASSADLLLHLERRRKARRKLQRRVEGIDGRDMVAELVHGLGAVDISERMIGLEPDRLVLIGERKRISVGHEIAGAAVEIEAALIRRELDGS